jgi:hypothetical protein
MSVEYKGYTQGTTIILAKPLPVPDGTEVAVIVPLKGRPREKKGRKRPSIVMDTFGLIPANPTLVRQVLQEDLYET